MKAGSLGMNKGEDLEPIFRVENSVFLAWPALPSRALPDACFGLNFQNNTRAAGPREARQPTSKLLRRRGCSCGLLNWHSNKTDGDLRPFEC